MFLFLLLMFSKLLASVKTIFVAFINTWSKRSHQRTETINSTYITKHKSSKKISDFKVNIISTKVYHKTAFLVRSESAFTLMVVSRSYLVIRVNLYTCKPWC